MVPYLFSLLDRTILVTLGILIGIAMCNYDRVNFTPMKHSGKDVIYLSCMEGHRSNTMITMRDDNES